MGNRKITLSIFDKQYSAEATDHKQENCFVCYMDLLGTCSNIQRGVDKEFLDGLCCVLDICKQIQHDKQRLKIKTFSDNICLFYSTSDDLQQARADFVDFFNIVSIFQLMLFVATAELVRGGIAAGRGLCEDALVWGDALTRAASMEESNENKYPRIAIDKESCAPYMSDTAANYLLRNEKGLPYLDFFAFAQGANDAEALQATQQRLVEKIKRTFRTGNDIKGDVLAKLRWFVRFCNLKARQLGRDDLILEASFKTPDGNEISLFAEEITNGKTTEKK